MFTRSNTIIHSDFLYGDSFDEKPLCCKRVITMITSYCVFNYLLDCTNTFFTRNYFIEIHDNLQCMQGRGDSTPTPPLPGVLYNISYFKEGRAGVKEVKLCNRI